MIEEKKVALIYDEVLGDDFNKYLKSLRLIPEAEESSWKFRKRAFPIVWKNSPRLAMAFLLLLRHIDWSQENRDKYASLLAANPSKEKLEKFVKKFSSDPIVMRNYSVATDWIAKGVIPERLPPPSPPENSQSRVRNDDQTPLKEVDKNFPKRCIEVVCRKLEISPEDMLARDRTSRIVFARQVAIYFMRDSGLSFLKIGNVFKRDHTTAIHSYRQINRKKKTDRELAKTLEDIRREL